MQKLVQLPAQPERLCVCLSCTPAAAMCVIALLGAYICVCFGMYSVCVHYCLVVFCIANAVLCLRTLFVSLLSRE